jgi:hemerythrin
MKQKKLVQEVYQACLSHDAEKMAHLRKVEFKKIFKHRAEGKPFSTRWSVVKL